jgi:hypothetical protein
VLNGGSLFAPLFSPVAIHAAHKRGGNSPLLALRPVANRTKQPFVSTHGSDGVNTHGKYLSRHRINPGGCFGGFRLVFANRCREAAGFNDITVSARVRYPSGTGNWQTVQFSAANSVAITSTGNDVTSDPLAVIASAGEYVDVETYVQVASVGQKWPTIDALSLASVNGEGQLLGTSSLVGQTPSAGNVTEFYGPIAILGNSTATRAIAVIGDSIANGATDTLTGDRIGFIERVFGGSYPILQLASSSEKISDFITSHTKRIAQLDASGITDIVFAFGTNDVMNGDTYNTLRHSLLTLLAYLASKGKAITICPVLTKTSSNITTPSTGFTVGGIADQLNTLLTGDMGLVSKVWDTRPAWQNASNHILSATYTDDFLHPNATGNAAIASAAPAASTLLADSVPTEPVASAYIQNNWKVFWADSLNALADGAAVSSWSTRDSSLTASATAGQEPTLKKSATPGGKSAVRFSSAAASGLQKLVVPATAAINNIMDTGAWGAIYTVVKPASAGGNGTGRVWTKGAGETEALTSATNLRTTIDFNTTDIALNGTVAAGNWYVRQFYKNTSNAGSLLQNTLNAATATGTGSTTHVDNSASNFVIGNHDSLARGWDGDIALIAIMKGTTSTADQLWAAQAYFRALTGVTLI